METKKELILQKPRIIQAFMAGFNSTANHVYLLILPILLDLFLWFGPHFSTTRAFSPIIENFRNLVISETADLQDIFSTFANTLEELLASFNLASLLRTIPVGVPSLLSGRAATVTPLGTPTQLDIPSMSGIVLVMLAFFLVGIIIGSFYFHQTANTVLTDLKKYTLKEFFRSITQVFLIPFALVIILFIMLLPVSFIVSILTLINAQLGQFGLAVLLFLIVWFSIPLLFTPHGIFLFKQNLIQSILTSIRVVRYSLPGSALFFTLALLLSNGMRLLWNIPPDNSWMLFVGIFGHAFISTAVLAATYHYFLDAAQYTQAVMDKIKYQETLT